MQNGNSERTTININDTAFNEYKEKNPNKNSRDYFDEVLKDIGGTPNSKVAVQPGFLDRVILDMMDSIINQSIKKDVKQLEILKNELEAEILKQNNLTKQILQKQLAEYSYNIRYSQFSSTQNEAVIEHRVNIQTNRGKQKKDRKICRYFYNKVKKRF